ncbi:MAG: hypothetical protein QGD93_02560 [Actinomycetota bacterium]|nr:hypothetical protein [Actinomycetota bacterium]
MSQLFEMGVKRTTGLEGLGPELIRETQKVARKALSSTSTVLARRMRQKLSKKGGPSAPGEAPARVEGALRDSIGKDRPRRDGDTMSVKVGVGVGRAKARKVDEWKAKGVNVFEYAALHEHGGIGADGRRYPPRSYARAAEEETEAEIDSMLRAAFG